MTVWTCARHRDAGVASVAALLLLAVATDAGAFRIAVERVVGVGVHAAIELPPATPSFDQTDPAAVAALLAGIDFTEQADRSEYGMAPEAVAYLAFADGAVERYELLSGYEYLARPGLPGACYALADATSDQLRAMTRTTPCAATLGACNGSCSGAAACAPYSICIGGPLPGYPCSDPTTCLGAPCLPVACICLAE